MRWVEWMKVIVPFVLLGVTGLVAIATFFGKKMIDGFAEHLKEMRVDLDRVERDLLNLKATLPRVYVLKDDHIRHMTIIENKIDEQGRDMQGRLGEMNNDIKAIFRELPKRKTDGES